MPEDQRFKKGIIMKTYIREYLIVAIICLIASSSAFNAAGETVEPIKYGDMEHWVIRHIKESKIIGGKSKTLYAIGPTQTIDGSVPYTNRGGSPWISGSRYRTISFWVSGSYTSRRWGGTSRSCPAQRETSTLP